MSVEVRWAVKSRVRVTVSTEVDVEIEVEHAHDELATDLTAEERRRAIGLAGLPGRPTIERVWFIGHVPEYTP
jgi:hypothetical protein